MTIASIQKEIEETVRQLMLLKDQLQQERKREAAQRIRIEPGGALFIAIGRAIKDARERAELTQEDLAKLVGIGRTSITNIEAGKQRLPIDLLYDIADVLEVQAATLLPRNENV